MVQSAICMQQVKFSCVCLIPVTRLDTALLEKWDDKVMQTLKDLFFLFAVLTENHVYK